MLPLFQPGYARICRISLSRVSFGYGVLGIREAYINQNRWISGKFPKGLWPPPRPFFGKKCCDFFLQSAPNLQQNFSDRKWPPPFLTFFRKIMTKICVFKAKKNATKFFGSEMTPPPFRKFSGNSSLLGNLGFPKMGLWLCKKKWIMNSWVHLVVKFGPF